MSGSQPHKRSGNLTRCTCVKISSCSSSQEARFQLGPLYCSGEEEEEEESRETDSCLALWRAGDTQAGYRMVRSHLDRFPKVGGKDKPFFIYSGYVL